MDSELQQVQPSWNPKISADICSNDGLLKVVQEKVDT